MLLRPGGGAATSEAIVTRTPSSSDPASFASTPSSRASSLTSTGLPYSVGRPTDGRTSSSQPASPSFLKKNRTTYATTVSKQLRVMRQSKSSTKNVLGSRFPPFLPTTRTSCAITRSFAIRGSPLGGGPLGCKQKYDDQSIGYQGKWNGRASARAIIPGQLPGQTMNGIKQELYTTYQKSRCPSMMVRLTKRGLFCAASPLPTRGSSSKALTHPVWPTASGR